MKLDKVANSQNDEFYTPLYAIKPIAKYIPPHSTIWCHFDTKDSLFVKCLAEQGHYVCYSHKDMGYDFFECEIPKCDYIISNPPFSIKEKVFERCLEYEKDFILVLPETFIFSVGFYKLLQKYNFHYKIYSPKQRVYFIDQDGNQNRPNFHTILIYVSKQFAENTIEHFCS